jgi:hypothetical protein
MTEQRHFLTVVWPLFAALFVFSCVGKRPDDDVAMIKGLLAKFERGINQLSEEVLDSIVLDREQNLSSRLLDNVSSGKKLEGARIADKSFVIVGDSAQVELKLSLQYATDTEEPEQTERRLELSLYKRKGSWKIQSYSTASDEGQ